MSFWIVLLCIADLSQCHSSGFDAGPLAEVLSKFTPIPVPYKDPIDWTRMAVTAIGILGAALILRFISPIVQNRWLWAVITVVTMLVMTSGFMFVRIRGAPYTGGNGQWVAAGYSNQYGQEVQVVAFICKRLPILPYFRNAKPVEDGLLSFAFLMLIMIVPTQSSPHRQRLQIYLWTGVIMIMYSVLVSLFRVKNRGWSLLRLLSSRLLISRTGYPFKLFL